MTTKTEQFWRLCLVGDEAFQEDGDVRPLLICVLQFVQSAPESRDELVRCFIELVQGRGPWEVAYFCMRHLKWPEVYTVVTDILRESDDFRVKTVMAHIRHAYTENQADDYLY